MSIGLRGTSSAQDPRYKNIDSKLIKEREYPNEFKEHVEIRKVDLKLIKSWIHNKLLNILGFEDEFLTEYTISLLENKLEPLNPKTIQHLLTGFLDVNTPQFVSELWSLLLISQKSVGGISAELIEEKKNEIITKSVKQTQRLEQLEKIIGKQEPNEQARHVEPVKEESTSKPTQLKRKRESRSRSRERRSHSKRRHRRYSSSSSRSDSRSSSYHKHRSSRRKHDRKGKYYK